MDTQNTSLKMSLAIDGVGGPTVEGLIDHRFEPEIYLVISKILKIVLWGHSYIVRYTLGGGGDQPFYQSNCREGGSIIEKNE